MIRCNMTPLALVLLLTTAAGGQDWTRFRGPNGSGIGQADAIPVKWTDRDYHWSVKLAGVGHSSPVLWGSRVFVTSGDEATGDCIVEAIDTESGQRSWQYRCQVDHHRKHDLNSFASATPVVTERHLYICWGNSEEVVLLALNHEGQEAWRQQLGTFHSGHGFGVSPIVHDDLVILPIEHQKQSTIFALNQSDGQVRWDIERDSRLHYATPCLLRLNDADALIFANWQAGVTAVEALSGRILWNCDVFDKSHVESSIASPIVAGELVIATCGWLGHGNEVIAVRPDGAGTGAELVWRIDRAAPLCCTPLVHHGMVFLWSDNGIVTCADLKSGQRYWQERIGGKYYASPVCVAGRLYNTSVDGEVVVLAAARQYQLLARNKLAEGSHSTVAVSGGRMYLRTFSHLMSLGG